MTPDELASLIRVFDASQCEEMVLEAGGARVELRRRGGLTPSPIATPEAEPVSTEVRTVPASGRSDPTAAPRATMTPVSPVVAAANAGRSGGSRPPPPGTAEEHIVRAPMVGTFYRAPKPGAPPFVEPNAPVVEGQPLCIIEVMKMMNVVGASRAARVVDVLVDDATLVEFEQPLFIVEPVRG